jgi:Putative lumazine-binding
MHIGNYIPMLSFVRLTAAWNERRGSAPSIARPAIEAEPIRIETYPMGPTTTHLNRPYEAVTLVLSDYFDALYESDATKLSRVFHPLAHYVCVSDGTLQYLRMNEYLPIVENRPSPASRSELRHDRV